MKKNLIQLVIQNYFQLVLQYVTSGTSRFNPIKAGFFLAFSGWRRGRYLLKIILSLQTHGDDSKLCSPPGPSSALLVAFQKLALSLLHGLGMLEHDL